MDSKLRNNQTGNSHLQTAIYIRCVIYSIAFLINKLANFDIKPVNVLLYYGKLNNTL